MLWSVKTSWKERTEKKQVNIGPLLKIFQASVQRKNRETRSNYMNTTKMG